MLSLGNSLKVGIDHLRRLIYPQSCLHCGSFEMMENRFFCDLCLKELELLISGQVISDNQLYNAMAAAFEYGGVAKSLVQAMKFKDMPYLAPVAAAYLVCQWSSLKWPWPDVIVPVPQSCFCQISRGYNQSALIAEALSKMMGVPCKQVLKRRAGRLSQAMMPKEARKQLDPDLFFVRGGHILEGKKVFVIDDVIVTGATMSASAIKLIDYRPASLYALAVCRMNKVL